MADQGMPTTYETQTTSQPAIGFHKEYVMSLPGILKIAEIVLCTVVFICSVSALWRGQGWVEFVCLSAVLSTIALFIMHLLNVISRLPGPWKLIEFIYYCVYTGLFIIAAIVAAAQASHSSGAVGACAFFAFAATAVYAVDTFFQFRAWRSGQTEMSTHTTTTTTAGGNPEAAKTTY